MLTYSVYVMLFSLLCFFFFKQKTAYEMRISDWSSDVCSSDLARPALFVWSGNENLSNATAPVLALLAAGFLTNALLQLPFYLQLASGRTRVLVRCFALIVALTIPALLWVVPRYGVVGAAAVWLGFQAISLRSEEHTSEVQSLMRISYAVFC